MEKKTNKKIIGIIGGMGPQASAEFYQLLIRKSTQDYGVVNNDEFPEILIVSVPVPDFISNTLRLDEAKEMLIERVKRMNAYEVTYIGIACNTAHILLPDLQIASKIPIVSIIEEIKKLVKMNGSRRVGLLATITTYRLGLYDAIESRQIKLFKPSMEVQNQLEDIIRRIIRGESQQVLREKLSILSDDFIQQNKLDTVILGCTELPLVFYKTNSVRVINSLEVLADSLLRIYFN